MILPHSLLCAPLSLVATLLSSSHLRGLLLREAKGPVARGRRKPKPPHGQGLCCLPGLPAGACRLSEAIYPIACGERVCECGRVCVCVSVAMYECV